MAASTGNPSCRGCYHAGIIAKKEGEPALVGPTDPVTNRAVIQAGLARTKMFRLLASVKPESVASGMYNAGITTKKEGEPALVGPTDSVTNQAVTQAGLARNKMFRLLDFVNAVSVTVRCR